MDREQATQDLELIARVLDQTRRRVDPQMFHAIIWGSIVLVWYPLMNWFERRGNGRAELILGIAATGLGFALSSYLGWRQGRRPRLAASNTRFARCIGAFTATIVGTGVLLSIAVPALAPGGERFIPHVWGMLYALMLMTLGVFYSREFFWCGLPSLAATLFALHWPGAAGFILGPAMGLGCIVAGVIAERRVARLRRESAPSLDGDDDGAHEEE
jgi:hypothetical protein